MNLKKYIKIPKIKEEDKPKDLSKLNIFDSYELEESEENELYNVDAISFNELKCTFTQEKSINVSNRIMSEYSTGSNKIIALKCKKNQSIQTLRLNKPD